MKIIFLGTPDFAVKPLQALLDGNFDVIAVVCQPDKPSLRGNKVVFSPVKQLAIKNNIKVFQYEKISRDGVEELKSLQPDLMVTAAYGQILSQEVIDIPKFGIINVHGSLLPKYRGSSPIQWALINGEKETGVTIAQTEKGLDTGDILLQETIKIEETDNSETLFEKLSELGSKLLIKAVLKIQNGTITRTKQNENESTYYPMIKKEDSLINFNEKTKVIINKIKGYYAWPTAYFMLNDLKIKVFEAKEVYCNEENITNFKNGQIVKADSKNGLIIKTDDGFIEIKVIQVPNGKKISARDYLNGHSLEVGDFVG